MDPDSLKEAALAVTAAFQAGDLVSFYYFSYDISQNEMAVRKLESLHFYQIKIFQYDNIGLQIMVLFCRMLV